MYNIGSSHRRKGLQQEDEWLLGAYNHKNVVRDFNATTSAVTSQARNFLELNEITYTSLRAYQENYNHHYHLIDKGLGLGL